MSATPTSINLNDTAPAAPAGQLNVKWQASAERLDPNNPPNLVRDVSANAPNIGGVDARTTTSETVHLASQGKLVTFKNSSAVAVTLDSAAGAGFFCAVENLGAGTATLTPSSGTINGAANLALTTGSGGWLFFDGTNWEAVTGGGGGGSFTAGGDLSGSSSSQEVIGIQSKPIDGGPTDGAALLYSASSGKWEPTVPPVGLLIGFIMGSGAVGTNTGPELPAPRNGAISKCVVVTKSSDPTATLTFRIKRNGVDIFSADPSIAAGTAPGTVSTFTSLSSVPLAVTANDVFTIDVLTGNANWQFSVELTGTGTVGPPGGSIAESDVMGLVADLAALQPYWRSPVLTANLIALTDTVAAMPGGLLEIASGVVLDLSASTGLTCMEVS